MTTEHFIQSFHYILTYLTNTYPNYPQVKPYSPKHLLPWTAWDFSFCWQKCIDKCILLWYTANILLWKEAGNMFVHRNKVSSGTIFSSYGEKLLSAVFVTVWQHTCVNTPHFLYGKCGFFVFMRKFYLRLINRDIYAKSRTIVLISNLHQLPLVIYCSQIKQKGSWIWTQHFQHSFRSFARSMA